MNNLGTRSVLVWLWDRRKKLRLGPCPGILPEQVQGGSGFLDPGGGGRWGWVTELGISGWAINKWTEDTKAGPDLVGDIIFPGFLSGQRPRSIRTSPGTNLAFELLWTTCLQLLEFYCSPWSLLGQSFSPHSSFLVVGSWEKSLHLSDPQCFHL